MHVFEVKSAPLQGTNYQEVSKAARRVFGELKRQTKRKLHVRSAYFKKQKVFFDYFWPHLLEKILTDRTRRLRLLPCAIELIQKSLYKPEEIYNVTNGKKEFFFRFYGQTRGGEKFLVQIKKNPTSNTLQCISIFPIK